MAQHERASGAGAGQEVDLSWAAQGPRLAAACVASLLPAAWRRGAIDRLPLAHGTALTGALQAVAAIFIGAYAFAAYSSAAMEMTTEAAHRYVLETGDLGGGRGAAMGTGAMIWVAFLLSPVGLLCLYNMAEGMVRAVAGAIAGQAVAPAPMALLGLLWSLARRAVAAHAAGAPVADVVVRRTDGSVARIESCRPRRWDGITLEFEDRFYVVTAYERLPSGMRPHVYTVADLPPGQPIRGPHHYAPDELTKVNRS